MLARFVLSCLALVFAESQCLAQSPTSSAASHGGDSAGCIAHAHNDYLHDRPLQDALAHGFGSVEADVFLVDGDLLVAHSRFEIATSRTLKKLYLDPLRQRVRENGGSVYGDGKSLILLIDFKAEGEKCYRALDALLADYPELFPVFPVQPTAGQQSGEQPADLHTMPVVVVISGDRPVEAILDDASRRVGIDGRLSDLESTLSPSLMPVLSDSWSKHFKWQGTGAMPDDEFHKLQAIVAQVHASRRKLRFWAAPDNEATWAVLRDAGVDLINTDKLAELSQFLGRARLNAK